MGVSTPLIQPPATTVNGKFLVRFLMVFVGCVLASGTLSGFPTIQPLLADAGAFETLGDRKKALSLLSSTYTVASGISIGLYLILGWLYDRFGARWSGIVGALGAAFGMGLMAVSVAWPRQLSYLLFVALPLTDTLGFLNSMALYGFIYHVPRYQATVLGVANASAQLTAAMAFVLVALVRPPVDLPLHYGFLVLAGLAVCAALLSAIFTPGQPEFFRMAARANGLPPDLSSPTARETDETGGLMTVNRIGLWQAVRDTVQVMRMHSQVTAAFLVSQSTAYFLFQYWFAYYLPFAEDQFGKETGARLGNGLSLAYAVCGGLLTPALGPVLDRLGLFRFFVCSTLVFVAYVMSSMAGTVIVQAFSIGAALLFFCGWMTFLTKWATAYCPPALFGTYFGVMFSGIAVMQMLVNLVFPPLVRKFLPGPPVNVYYFFFLVYGVLGVLGSLLLIAALAARPPPLTPPTLDHSSGGSRHIQSSDIVHKKKEVQ